MYFTATCDISTALEHRNNSDWDVWVKECGGIGHLDLILQRMGDDTRVLHEHPQEQFTLQDKWEGDSNSQHKKLMKKAEEALVQLETRQYDEEL